MQQVILSVTPVGVTSAAVGTSTASVFHVGKLYAVYLDYVAGMTSATNVQLKQETAPQQTLLTVSGTASGWFFPRSTLVTAAAASTSGNAPFPVTSYLALAVATATPVANAVTAYIYIE